MSIESKGSMDRSYEIPANLRSRKARIEPKMVTVCKDLTGKIITIPSMKEILAEAEIAMPDLLRERKAWEDIKIDDGSVMHRIYRKWEGYRIQLHKITMSPLAIEPSLHYHQWPSIVHLHQGKYEMGVGYGKGFETPPVCMTTLIGAGNIYEMIDPDCWHYTRPVNGPTYSTMIVGKRWENRPPPTTIYCQMLQIPHLTEEERNEMFNKFEVFYAPDTF